MSVTIEARIHQLLKLDPVCQGQVSGTTVRTMALEFAREPEPDSDVLAERDACLDVMEEIAARANQITISGGGTEGPWVVDFDQFQTERRRTAEAIQSVRLGLHRDLQSEPKGA